YVGRLLGHPYWLTVAMLGPKILAQPRCVVGDERIGRVQNVAIGTVVLFQPDHIAVGIVALEVGHVADVGSAECIDGLVVVAHSEYSGAPATQKLNPAILQGVRVLKFVDEYVTKPPLIVFANRNIIL